MILRILKQSSLPGVGIFAPGQVVNIPADVAADWIKSGKARFYDGKPFVKAVSPPENKMEMPPENKGEATESTTSPETEVVDTIPSPAKAKPKKKRKK